MRMICRYNSEFCEFDTDTMKITPISGDEAVQLGYGRIYYNKDTGVTSGCAKLYKIGEYLLLINVEGGIISVYNAQHIIIVEKVVSDIETVRVFYTSEHALYIDIDYNSPQSDVYDKRSVIYVYKDLKGYHGQRCFVGYNGTSLSYIGYSLFPIDYEIIDYNNYWMIKDKYSDYTVQLAPDTDYGKKYSDKLSQVFLPIVLPKILNELNEVIKCIPQIYVTNIDILTNTVVTSPCGVARNSKQSDKRVLSLILSKYWGELFPEHAQYKKELGIVSLYARVNKYNKGKFGYTVRILTAHSLYKNLMDMRNVRKQTDRYINVYEVK